MKKQPNVIIITTDQQRYDSVRSNGSEFMETPNMDRLAEEGAAFDRAYCPNTVCTPSRASIMTGLHLSRHGAYNIGTTAVDHSIFLSHLLRNNGYRTHHIGKAHWYAWGTSNPETKPVDEQGSPFQDFVGFHQAEISIGHAGPKGLSGHYAHWVKQKGIDAEQFEVHPLFDDDDNKTSDWDLPTKYHSGHWIAERAVDFMENHDQSQPFYLNLGFQDPHHPHLLPSDFTRRVDPALIPMPDVDLSRERDLADHIPHFHNGTINDTRFRGQFGMGGNQNTHWKDYFQDEEKARMTRSYYYSMVQLVDDQLGIILNSLDRLGLKDNTMVIFTSDHGEMLGDHSIGQKGPLFYEGVCKVPLMIRYPNGFAPCRIDECVSLVDLVPTVMDFVGIQDDIKRDGISLKDPMQGERTISRPGVRIEYKEEPDRIRYKGWITPEWKLAVYLGEDFGELYDLKNDPGEKVNLFKAPKAQAVKNKLLIEMLQDMERSEPTCNHRISRV